MFVVLALAAIIAVPAAAAACTAGPYTECIPSAGGQHSGGGGTAGTSTSNIPTTSSESAGGGGNGSVSGSSANLSAKAKKKAKAKAKHKANKSQQSGAVPVGGTGSPPSSSDSGGMSAVAWILIALALIALIAGSVLVMRNRRNQPDTAGDPPGPKQPGTASPDAS